MLYKIKYRIIICLCLIISIVGCSEERDYKSDTIIGYWHALQKSDPFINGIQATKYQREYYYRFLDNNCGYLYDTDENWINDFKWVLQEGKKKDKLLISVTLNAQGQSTFLSETSIATIEEFEEMNFTTFYIESNTVGEDVINTGHQTFFVRQ